MEPYPGLRSGLQVHGGRHWGLGGVQRGMGPEVLPQACPQRWGPAPTAVHLGREGPCREGGMPRALVGWAPGRILEVCHCLCTELYQRFRQLGVHTMVGPFVPVACSCGSVVGAPVGTHVGVCCGVVWCGVPKALLPEGKGRNVYPRVRVNGRAVCVACALCVVCVRWSSPLCHFVAAAGPVRLGGAPAPALAAACWRRCLRAVPPPPPSASAPSHFGPDRLRCPLRCAPGRCCCRCCWCCCCNRVVAHCSLPPPRYQSSGYGGAAPEQQSRSCGVVWCGVVWCDVVWCGVVWCGVVWCGVVWCSVV